MLRVRIIPALLLKDDALVKTVKFTSPKYIGDPINTVRIFNELEVDELCFLDITATNEKRAPNFKVLSEIADECFMPLAYGGGLNDFETACKIFSIGFEKVVINTATHTHPDLITRVAAHYGNQAVIASIDVKRNFFGKQEVYSHSGKVNTKKRPEEWAQELEKLGAGEILLTSIDREGTWSGFDIELIRRISQEVSVPVIAHGGAGTVTHINEVIENTNTSAVALGSMVVYQQKGMGVLINFPDHHQIVDRSMIRKAGSI